MKINNYAQPLITVITLSYNSPDLKCAIDSLLSQTYQNIQYVLIDDCSNVFDESEIRNYIEENQNGNIKELIVRRSEKNLGIVKEKNIALSFAKGKYLFNLSGDDCFADENVLQDWVDEFEKSGASVLTAKRMVYDETMTKIIKILPTEKDIQAINELTPKQLFEYMSGSNCIFGCCTARRRDTVDKYGPFDERYLIIDDYSIIMRLLRFGQKIDFFDRIVIKYRQGGISYCENVNKKYLVDAEELFYHEIYPYLENPKEAKKNFLSWKKGLGFAQWHRKYIGKRKKYENKKLGKVYLGLWVGFTNFGWLVKKFLKR